MTKLEFLKNVLQLHDRNLLQDAQNASQICRVRKGSHLFDPGEVPARICLLVEGIFRSFFLDTDGREITDCLVTRPGVSLMPVSDLRLASPATVEALTDASVFCLPVPEFALLAARYSAVQELYQRMLLYSSDYHRQLKVMMYQYTAAQRYHWFLKHYPGVMDQISHRYIASFLNMTPVTLSRLVNTPDLPDTTDQLLELFPFPDPASPET